VRFRSTQGLVDELGICNSVRFAVVEKRSLLFGKGVRNVQTIAFLD
jgi:hypothetical protein